MNRHEAAAAARHALHTSARAAALAIREDDAPAVREALDAFRPHVLTLDEGEIRNAFLRAVEAAGELKHDGEALADWMYQYVCDSPERQAADQAQAEQVAKELGGPVLPVEPVSTTPPERFQAAILPSVIRLAADTLAEQMEAVADALADPRLALYQHAGGLVQMARIKERADTGRARVALRPVPVNDLRLVELLSRVRRFEKWDARTRAFVPARCPPDLARTYLARAGAEWRLPSLEAVIHAPTLRQDGSVLDVPGYDPATGLLFDPGGQAVPYVADRPDRADAYMAAETLDELLAEFPFVDLQDDAVAVAAILTAVVRRSLPAAPLFAFTAPAPGSGKSYLVDIVSLIATGQAASGLTWTGDAQEDRKALDSALLAGAAAIHLDNVSTPLGGDRLNQLLTQTTATVRRLGHSENVEVPSRAIVTANGNNLAIAADLTRRTLLCRLDAQQERPELRRFDGDPVAMIRADRGRYLAAALTILRAYHVAGRPEQPKPLGSFEAWSAWVRGAVMWCGYADPVASMEAARENDPRRADLAAVLGRWDGVIGDRRVTSAQLIDAATQDREFREALLAVAGSGGAVNTQRLGIWLRANRGRIVGGLHVEPAGVLHGAARWTLEGGRRAGDAAPPIRLVGELVP